MENRGTLVLVVGPSGVGKDSLLDGARAALAGSPDFVFPRRMITRPAAAGGENHRAVTEPEFDALQAARAFALDWRAHNLRYGVPASIAEDLASGKHVVVNVSRSVIISAHGLFSPVKSIYVTVPRQVLAQRLRARGREPEADILKRLQQSAAYEIPEDPDTYVLNNTTSLEKSVRVFIAILRSIARNEPTPLDIPFPGTLYG